MVVLASASPRRRELLGRLLSEFQVVPSEVDETLDAGAGPEAVAGLALRKARAVAARLGTGIVLGADTVVVVEGQALGKPTDADEARGMLRRIRGRAHEVITGVAVVDAATERSAATAVVSRVLMRAYSDRAVDDYVASGEPLDKAGGYAIQGMGSALVGGWLGSYSNVVGLPLQTVAGLLADFGVPLDPVGARSPA